MKILTEIVKECSDNERHNEAEILNLQICLIREKVNCLYQGKNVNKIGYYNCNKKEDLNTQRYSE